MGMELEQIKRDIKELVAAGDAKGKSYHLIAEDVVAYLLRNALLQPEHGTGVVQVPPAPENPADRPSEPPTTLSKARLALLDAVTDEPSEELRAAGVQYAKELPFTFGVVADWCTDDSAHDYHYRIGDDNRRQWCGGTGL